MITQQMLTNLHTFKIYTHKVIYTHTLTQSETAFQCVGSPLKP